MPNWQFEFKKSDFLSLRMSFFYLARPKNGLVQELNKHIRRAIRQYSLTIKKAH